MPISGLPKTFGLYPNVSGQFRTLSHEEHLGKSSGSFSDTSFNPTYGVTADTFVGGLTYNFSATKSSSIFGKNTKIQPRATYALIIIKA